MTRGAGASREIVRRGRAQYGAVYDSLRFPSPEIAVAAGQSRRDALHRLVDRGLQVSCKQTKLHTGPLSPGCRECAAASWSCLFVNGVCNASCFFCPKETREYAAPVAEGIQFPEVDEYVAYLADWKCRGASISGGEPLLNWDCTADFISGIRRRLGQDVQLWLYTNGKLATRDRLRALQAEGLEEIRFNIAARDYCIDGLEEAACVFDSVVVEIPVIPEDADRVRRLIPTLERVGVNYLNLHQLWASEKSIAQLARRDYTLLHGPWISVLESELAALELLGFTLEHCSTLSAHYCSSAFKQRYQTMAAFKRHAAGVTRSHEEITEAGLVRTRWLGGTRQEVDRLLGALKEACVPQDVYRLDECGSRLLFKGELPQSIAQSALTSGLRYDVVSVSEAKEGHGGGSVRDIVLSDRRKLSVRRTPVYLNKALSTAERRSLDALLGHRHDAGECPNRARPALETDLDLTFLEEIGEYEWLEGGLPQYY